MPTKLVSIGQSHRGMTLIELMVVIVLIGILTTAVTFGVIKYLDDGKKKTAQIQVNKIRDLLNIHYVKEGTLPESLEELTHGIDPPLKEKQLRDPWDEYLLYSPGTIEGERFMLVSKGPDGKASTDDDIKPD